MDHIQSLQAAYLAAARDKGTTRRREGKDLGIDEFLEGRL